MPRWDLVCEIFVEEVAREIRENFQTLRPVEKKREEKRMGQEDCSKVPRKF